MISGVGIIWCSASMDRVMKGEIYMLAPAALVAMIGELFNDLNTDNPHFWYRIIVEGAAMMIGIICYVIYRLALHKF